MKTTIACIVLGCAAFGALAQTAAPAAAEEKKPTAQQMRMTSCNKDAADKALKGDERKAFMSKCLSGETEGNSQQNKMKTCNEEAGKKGLKGEERKTFMSQCLKN